MKENTLKNKEIIFPSIDILPHQQDFWHRFVNNNLKRSILIWHRRAGKDVISFLAMVQSAIRKSGLYWYIFPLYTQARKSFWEAFLNQNLKYIDLIPKELIKKKRDDEMYFELINGSIIRFVGGDKTDSLVGSNPNGVVISEYALQNPSLWEIVLEPILTRNKGWVIFNSTPRGENHCYDMYNYLKNSNNQEHYASRLSVDDTKIITLQEIDEMRIRGKPEELIQQEFYCSFAGAMTGSYYNDILNSIAESNLLDNITYDGEAMVQTLWDLGVSDSMALWFVTVRANRIEVLDYYEANGYGLGHYVDVINSKPYKYLKHNLPHDGGHRTLSTAEKASTIQNQLLQLGLNNVIVHDRTNDIYGDIQAVRGILNKCYFDKSKCKRGLDCLKNYRREFDEKRNCFREQPIHDWTSHGADAFRILPKIYNKLTNNNNITKHRGGYQCQLYY